LASLSFVVATVRQTEYDAAFVIKFLIFSHVYYTTGDDEEQQARMSNSADSSFGMLCLTNNL